MGSAGGPGLPLGLPAWGDRPRGAGRGDRPHACPVTSPRAPAHARTLPPRFERPVGGRVGRCVGGLGRPHRAGGAARSPRKGGWFAAGGCWGLLSATGCCRVLPALPGLGVLDWEQQPSESCCPGPSDAAAAGLSRGAVPAVPPTLPAPGRPEPRIPPAGVSTVLQHPPRGPPHPGALAGHGGGRRAGAAGWTPPAAPAVPGALARLRGVGAGIMGAPSPLMCCQAV